MRNIALYSVRGQMPKNANVICEGSLNINSWIKHVLGIPEVCP